MKAKQASPLRPYGAPCGIPHFHTLKRRGQEYKKWGRMGLEVGGLLRAIRISPGCQHAPKGHGSCQPGI
jgi:hypothetical protein